MLNYQSCGRNMESRAMRLKVTVCVCFASCHRPTTLVKFADRAHWSLIAGFICAAKCALFDVSVAVEAVTSALRLTHCSPCCQCLQIARPAATAAALAAEPTQAVAPPPPCSIRLRRSRRQQSPSHKRQQRQRWQRRRRQQEETRSMQRKRMQRRLLQMNRSRPA